MSAMGVTIPQFDVPVCNSFQAKILNDQLCYEVDLKKFSNKNNIFNELKLGFNFLLDYNEDRQVTLHQEVHSKSTSPLKIHKQLFIWIQLVKKIKCICIMYLKGQ